MDWTSQKAHSTSNFWLSQTNRFLLSFKPVWAVFSIIAKMTIHPPDILLQLRRSVLQVPEQEGRVWSEKILSWHRWYVTASLDFNSFSWGGGKVRQVHLQAYGEGATSQSAKAQMKGCLLCLNETLCMFRGLGLPEPGGAGVLWVPGLLGGHGKVSGNPWHPDTVEEFCVCIFSFKWYKVI